MRLYPAGAIDAAGSSGGGGGGGGGGDTTPRWWVWVTIVHLCAIWRREVRVGISQYLHDGLTKS